MRHVITRVVVVVVVETSSLLTYFTKSHKTFSNQDHQNITAVVLTCGMLQILYKNNIVECIKHMLGVCVFRMQKELNVGDLRAYDARYDAKLSALHGDYYYALELLFYL